MHGVVAPYKNHINGYQWRRFCAVILKNAIKNIEIQPAKRFPSCPCDPGFGCHKHWLIGNYVEKFIMCDGKACLKNVNQPH